MIFKSDVMNINFKEAVSYLTFKELEKYNFLKHAYSTRLGGVSENEFKSLNFGFNTGDSQERVNKNYDIFCKAVGIDRNNLVMTSQVHEDKICVVNSGNNSSGKETRFDGTDALITSERGVGLVTFHADCAAVYIVDTRNKVIGLAHAGWRGTVKNIAGKLAKKFMSEYNSSVNDIVCCLGPSIGPCCFEVSDSLLKYFNQLGIPQTYIHYAENKIKINLLEVNRQLLIKSGLRDENIIKSDVCTMCNHDLLFSHRATNGKRGCNVAFLSLC